MCKLDLSLVERDGIQIQINLAPKSAIFVLIWVYVRVAKFTCLKGQADNVKIKWNHLGTEPGTTLSSGEVAAKKQTALWAIGLWPAVGNSGALGKILEEGSSLTTVIVTCRSVQEELEQDGDLKAARRVFML